MSTKKLTHIRREVVLRVYVPLAHRNAPGTRERVLHALRLSEQNGGIVWYFGGGDFYDHTEPNLDMQLLKFGSKSQKTSTTSEVAEAVEKLRAYIKEQEARFDRVILTFVTGNGHEKRSEIVMRRHKVEGVVLQIEGFGQYNWNILDGAMEWVLRPMEKHNLVVKFKRLLGMN